MHRPIIRIAAAIIFAGLLGVGAPAVAKAPAKLPATVNVSIFAINDLHGNLMPPAGGISVPDPADPTKKIAVPAGGVEYMATLIHQLRAKHKNSVFVAAGDLIGASPLLSGMFHDEPTVDSLSLMGLEVSSVGNHEFDEGTTELLRMQNGGCHPVDGCKGPHRFKGAKYRYLAANVIDKATGKPFLPPYYVKRFSGIPVAFIGMTLKGTKEIVAPAGVKSIEFEDEVKTVNDLVPQLQAKGIQAIVVLIHQGGVPTGGYNDCTVTAGPIVDIVKKFDKAVDVIVSGHTHQAYNCVIDGRVVTSAHRYGTLVTEIDLRLSRKTHDVISAKADNLMVDDVKLKKDPAQTKLLAAYRKIADPIENQIEGTASALFSALPNAAGESTLGDLIADAQLAAAKPAGAQISFMNPGGIRTDLLAGEVTYSELFTIQPFGNTLVTMDLTGAQIKAMLEQQWNGPERVLLPSKGFAYTWDASAPVGGKVKAIALNGTPIDPAATYRVAVSDYLAGGGDGMTVFKQGTNIVAGMGDVDAMAAYIKTNTPVAPQSTDRIIRMN